MSPTDQQKQIVEQTFALVAGDADGVAQLFYTRLFEIDPALRPMFPQDMTDQRAKLMQTLTVAIRLINNPEGLVPALEALGKRHVHYGVESQHYQTVGAALLWTLDKGLGEVFTPEVREAWTAVYTFLATTAMGDLYTAAEPMA